MAFNWPNVSVDGWPLSAQIVWSLSLCKYSVNTGAETSVENPYIVCDEWVILRHPSVMDPSVMESNFFVFLDPIMGGLSISVAVC